MIPVVFETFWADTEVSPLSLPHLQHHTGWVKHEEQLYYDDDE